MTCTSCKTNQADPAIKGVTWCVTCYNADVREYRANANRNRRPRRQRQPLYGDFATIAMLNGIATDGSGKRIR